MIQRDLSAADNPAQCWSILQKACEEFGFHQVRLHLAGQSFDHRAAVEPLKSWSIRIPISDHDFIELTREFDVIGHATALAPFADMLRKTLSSKFRPSESPSRFRSSAVIQS